MNATFYKLTPVEKEIDFEELIRMAQAEIDSKPEDFDSEEDYWYDLKCYIIDNISNFIERIIGVEFSYEDEIDKEGFPYAQNEDMVDSIAEEFQDYIEKKHNA